MVQVSHIFQRKGKIGADVSEQLNSYLKEHSDLQVVDFDFESREDGGQSLFVLFVYGYFKSL